MEPTPPLLSISVDDVASVEAGPGCFRKDLPSPRRVRVWVVDMIPGSGARAGRSLIQRHYARPLNLIVRWHSDRDGRHSDRDRRHSDRD